MLETVTFSDVLGYASIGSWLGAQFPQVLENVRRQSADGLALPFLLNWALGDATNLLGCILTHQLPFQTYLATYFCFVDATLLVQFFYYRFKYPAKPSYLSARPRTTSVTARRMSVEREASHYRALSSVAANVAAAAALAAGQEDYARWRRNSTERGPYSAVEPRNLPDDDDDNVSDEALARLSDSFQSEGGRIGRGKKVSWSRERRGGSLGRNRQSTTSPSGQLHASLAMTLQPEEAEALARGRSLSREVQGDEGDEEWSASRRRSSRASRKGASMVFLGAWALFGIGTLASSQHGLTSSGKPTTGRVLSMSDFSPPLPQHAERVSSLLMSNPESHTDHIVTAQLFARDFEPIDFDSLNQPEQSTEFIIGRVSAWTCTILYLTSRLPQIWKNFVRKSVEGLSMYLFIFAFLGNFFYVSSILTSPKLGLPEAEASAFIKESIPYLLGSGGTLVFDVTIVTQSFIYRPKTHSRGRRASRAGLAEEEGLLSAGATGAEDIITPSRRRTGVSADSDAV
ncbi:uncharacterized protein FIBRA_06780 [Fibroporia radiculosa]|uniref:PQ-loop-domain-containing protein n=1 Tax=Fibroporia radiculosa TaxID=599839 RepID=J4GCH3_9APHY|nr:uncharacterized protein FIBRA_06780 [Fibroporia radiculosa]CCM04598.1 predicted protein [Fibroporia radiculosa]